MTPTDHNLMKTSKLREQDWTNKKQSHSGIQPRQTLQHNTQQNVNNTTQQHNEQHPTATDRLALSQDIEADTKHHDDTSLPPGWHIDGTGYIVLDDIQDEWQLKGNYLIRKHYLPRQTTYTPTQDDCPISISYLTNKRTSKMANNPYHDSWNKPHHKQFTTTWTGTTEFKIQPAYRKMAQEQFYSASEGYTTYIEKKKNNPSVRELCRWQIAFSSWKPNERS